MKRLICSLLAAACLIGGASAVELVNAADWAVPELTAAAEAGLLPDGATDWDMAGQISRAEFCAVAVRLYEVMSGASAPEGDATAFWDTTDPLVLQAVALGITNGVGGGRFAPDEAVSRQDAATMLTRVYKCVFLPGWSLAADAEFLLPLNGARFFEDHDRIDNWARDAVYFLSNHRVIRGDNAGNFHPHNNDGILPDNTGTAARQEAILMALRMSQAFPSPGA